MIVIQKLIKTGEGEDAIRKFLCMSTNVADMPAAVIMALALSESWAPTTPEEGVYIYDPQTNVVAHKFVNGIQVW